MGILDFSALKSIEDVTMYKTRATKKNSRPMVRIPLAQITGLHRRQRRIGEPQTVACLAGRRPCILRRLEVRKDACMQCIVYPSLGVLIGLIPKLDSSEKRL